MKNFLFVFAFFSCVILAYPLCAQTMRDPQWTACISSQECVVIEGTCGPVAVNKDFQEAAESYYRETPAGAQCPEAEYRSAGHAVCREQACVYPPSPGDHGRKSVEESERDAHDASADVRPFLEKADEQLEEDPGFQAVGLHQKARKIPQSYYQWLLKKCPPKDGCCKASARIMAREQYLEIHEAGCPEGFRHNQLRCLTSYTWCEPVEGGK